MRRREILSATTASLGLFGGCLNRSDNSPEVGLGEIEMMNVRENSIEAAFIVAKEGEKVYERTHTLEGNKNGAAGAIKIVEPWMGEKVSYDVTVSIVSSDQQGSFSTKDAEEFVSKWGDNDCFGLFITPKDEIYFGINAMESCPE